MENKDIIMYTMTTCGYCNEMKKKLNEKNITYIERDFKEYKEEWEYVKSLTRSAVFPTFVMGKEYLIPSRDFNNPEELINNLTYYQQATLREPTTADVVELIKNNIYMVKMLNDKVDNVLKKLNDFDVKKMGLGEQEKIRQQIVQRNKLVSEQKKAETTAKKQKIKESIQKFNADTNSQNIEKFLEISKLKNK
jgi:glutaredoxin